MLKNILQKISTTLRGKLSLWYLVSVGVIILTFLVASITLFWFTLENQIDHHVHITVNEAAQIIEEFEGVTRDELLTNLVSAQGMTIIVLSADGSPILETNSPDVALVTEHQLQSILNSSSLTTTEPVHFTNSNIRFAAMPVTISAGQGILAVGYSTQVIYSTFLKMLSVVVGIVFFLVLPVTTIGYRLLKQQLQPLEDIANQAQQITNTTLLSKKINVDASTQELTTIKKSLNSMLSKLEGIFVAERDFFSDAAHTLKTPLAVLRSQIENSKLSQKTKADIVTTIDQTNDTIQDLLFLSKVSNKQKPKTKFSLSELLKQLAELASTLAEEKQISVTTDIEDDIFVEANKNLLQRALSNIVHNAVIYNKEKGSLKISLQRAKDGVEEATIVIKDTGLGIEKKYQQSVFDRFSRLNSFAKNEVTGSGLGLAITKAVIENNQGKIELTSTPNQGTTITVTLPCLSDS